MLVAEAVCVEAEAVPELLFTPIESKRPFNIDPILPAIFNPPLAIEYNPPIGVSANNLSANFLGETIDCVIASLFNIILDALFPIWVSIPNGEILINVLLNPYTIPASPKPIPPTARLLPFNISGPIPAFSFSCSVSSSAGCSVKPRNAPIVDNGFINDLIGFDNVFPISGNEVANVKAQPKGPLATPANFPSAFPANLPPALLITVVPSLLLVILPMTLDPILLEESLAIASSAYFITPLPELMLLTSSNFPSMSIPVSIISPYLVLSNIFLRDCSGFGDFGSPKCFIISSWLFDMISLALLLENLLVNFLTYLFSLSFPYILLSLKLSILSLISLIDKLSFSLLSVIFALFIVGSLVTVEVEDFSTTSSGTSSLSIISDFLSSNGISKLVSSFLTTLLESSFLISSAISFIFVSSIGEVFSVIDSILSLIAIELELNLVYKIFLISRIVSSILLKTLYSISDLELKVAFELSLISWPSISSLLNMFILLPDTELDLKNLDLITSASRILLLNSSGSSLILSFIDSITSSGYNPSKLSKSFIPYTSLVTKLYASFLAFSGLLKILLDKLFILLLSE